MIRRRRWVAIIVCSLSVCLPTEPIRLRSGAAAAGGGLYDICAALWLVGIAMRLTAQTMAAAEP